MFKQYIRIFIWFEQVFASFLPLLVCTMPYIIDRLQAPTIPPFRETTTVCTYCTYMYLKQYYNKKMTRDLIQIFISFALFDI